MIIGVYSEKKCLELKTIHTPTAISKITTIKSHKSGDLFSSINILNITPIVLLASYLVTWLII
jgi:hypothetical protein